MRLPGLGKSRRAKRQPSSASIYHTEIIADVAVPERGESVRFFSRKLVRPGKLRRVSNKDLRETLLSLFYLGVATVLPVAWWAPMCNWASSLRRKRHFRKEFSRYDVAIKAVLGDDADTQSLFRGHLAGAHRRRLMLAAHLAPRRWAPAIRLEGADGLREALRRGRGAIVWCDQFIAQTIMGKRALFEAGIEAHQVSVNFHGFSESKFGLLVINRPLVAVENRFLKSRIVFERADAYQVTARIQKTLKENGVVLMTNTIHAGFTFTETAMGERGWTHLASAPANFAARAGAALFAMSTLETMPFREYRAIVSPELKPNAAQPASLPAKDVAAKNLVLQAGYILLKRDRLLEAVKLYPEQMMAWSGAQRLTGQHDQAAIGGDAA
ncbi:hypothetical protein EN836_07010 [Mesorhizobium sp. M1C.F.Ca.ET.193.01.1.1]|uniref:hypothetical protein n=1 Tax=unclassified Mesorhizobium TaxID=325217 RepID=UPI000FD333B4|nr:MULTISPECIES: hypothetical protein [unclassified Mesorhizobium]TGT02827.1 hypothetical protein EN820_24530 [bacterium M00.F.Ca.ET.177.01.1.1]TGQ55688.1 hypothetical protein EN853_07005 [Mesorhizobium sp. M1C.F.Ca.ET.210.01.1.1]TGQ74142.1 hypothetical protein EN855_007015 [Mesorhizobium sp. M1C.F.Ca.ET.212.01.1.1]TGR12772.1 hypothetical protein EN847_07010 [Mesorhizobium sp. M1C.F.Ca.ET.204.01.1.1]TGR32731.1 hypothetical protein EN839_07010 [Mesorhizobium sp. M1C.F.Ca.ET.196.01.1.1]